MTKFMKSAHRLLLWIAFCGAPLMAQVIVPDPRDGRIGTQLIIYFDMVDYDTGYITVTNTALSQVALHIQVFGAGDTTSATAEAVHETALLRTSAQRLEAFSR